MSLVATMYDILLEQDAWCYWVISIAALLSFVGFILACICSCRHNDNKSEFLGLAGMVTMTRSENDGYDDYSPPSPTDNSQFITQDAVDCGGKRANSANRSLPDIPKDKNLGHSVNGLETITQDVIYEAAEVMSDPLELYATVQDKNIIGKRNNERVIRAISQESSSLPEDDSAYPYARLNPVKTTTDEHPYAQVQNVQKIETNCKNNLKKNSSQIIDSNLPSTSSQSTNPVAPPRTRRSISQNSLLNVETSTCDIQAANAITGGVQANQDLPYMTPPLVLNLQRVPGGCGGGGGSGIIITTNSLINNQSSQQQQQQQQQHQQEQQQQQLQPQPQQQSQPQLHQQQQHFSGDSQDSKGYTSISVREPLANIIAQTKAQNRQKPQRPSADSHYATVSDDSDEMYAAIDEQDKIYTSGSETYAQIQPMTIVTETNHTEQLLTIPSNFSTKTAIIVAVSSSSSSSSTTTTTTTAAVATTTAITTVSIATTVVTAPQLPSPPSPPPSPLPSPLKIEEDIFSAPQPPSVDSLRHVAHAHSRQASSSSATSSIINPSSPKPEKRQANSPLPPPPPPPPFPTEEESINTTDPYAFIDKSGKLDDNKTQILSHSIVGKSLEDMYAKVMKRKRDSEEDTTNILSSNLNDLNKRKLSIVDVSRGLRLNRDTMEYNNINIEPDYNSTKSNNSSDLLNMHAIEFAKVSRIYELDKTPEYEENLKISSNSLSRVQKKNTRPRSNINLGNVDTNYELLKQQPSINDNNKLKKLSPSTSTLNLSGNEINVLPFYSVPFKNRQFSNASSEDPGYEKVRLRRRNDHNDIDTDSEPNYESMPHEPNYASVCRPGDSDTDPNYESVNNVDPNYESVRYMTGNKINQEPPYEQVSTTTFNKCLKQVDGYEKVKNKKKENVDSNYEKIQINDGQMMESVEISDDEQYVQV